MNKQNQYKFTEGEIHQFKIIGFTEIPGTDESFYILENPFGGKHLLKAVHYKHYNLRVNQTLNCRIDKINCSGKIYLEPENPFYKVGDIYEFEIIEIVNQINSVGENEKVAIVKDKFGIKIYCSLSKNFNPDNKHIICKILRIKKGELFLGAPEGDPKKNLLEIGKKYCFNVIEIRKLENETDYYILKDEYDNSYSLKKDMYQQYEFKINQSVECTVTKYNTDGLLKIEPTHPHYKIGKSYRFKYLSTIEETDPLGNKEFVILVEDIYGIETKVRSKNLTDVKKAFPEYINCKVEGIRKGKAILSMV